MVIKQSESTSTLRTLRFFSATKDISGIIPQ
jgi:hypothetical protein